MNLEEAPYQELTKELFNAVSHKELSKFLMEAFYAQIKEEVDNGIEEISGKIITSKVDLQHFLLYFFNQLDKIYNSKAISLDNI